MSDSTFTYDDAGRAMKDLGITSSDQDAAYAKGVAKARSFGDGSTSQDLVDAGKKVPVFGWIIEGIEYIFQKLMASGAIGPDDFPHWKCLFQAAVAEGKTYSLAEAILKDQGGEIVGSKTAGRTTVAALRPFRNKCKTGDRDWAMVTGAIYEMFGNEHLVWESAKVFYPLTALKYHGEYPGTAWSPKVMWHTTTDTDNGYYKTNSKGMYKQLQKDPAYQLVHTSSGKVLPRRGFVNLVGGGRGGKTVRHLWKHKPTGWYFWTFPSKDLGGDAYNVVFAGPLVSGKPAGSYPLGSRGPSPLNQAVWSRENWRARGELSKALASAGPAPNVSWGPAVKKGEPSPSVQSVRVQPANVQSYSSEPSHTQSFSTSSSPVSGKVVVGLVATIIAAILALA